MNKNKHYQKLTAHFTEIYHFEHFDALGNWDQATMMPKGGNKARSEASATLAKHIHYLKTQPWLDDYIKEAKQETLTVEQHANLREIERAYHLANAVSGDLITAKSLAASQCEYAWREQRQSNDWQGFKPNLQAVIQLTKEEAAMRAEKSNLLPYDALIDKYEVGMTSSQIALLFTPLKTWLPSLIQSVIEKQQTEEKFTLSGTFDVQSQAKLNHQIMTLMNFDFNHGRLDVSTHPFTGGVPDDVRLTTRFNENDFTHALMGTVHETGHALYEQGLPLSYCGQPAGFARSMGIHESQSLFNEMQIGRSKGFLTLIKPFINQYLNQHFTLDQLTNLYSRVSPGLIRVDADEVTYPCHILLRFEAEKALINGNLTVDDLPDYWSSQMQLLLGINTDGNYKDGCMQDIHWTTGDLGYFPSYTLGAMAAAQLRFAIEKQLGNIDDLIEQGKLPQIYHWLADKIWSKGSLLSTDDLLISATGETLNSQYLEKHLRQRYLQ